MLALIDYGSGNIRSVTNALKREGADVELVSDPARLADAEGIVLPGVGAFGDCVRGLQTRGLWEPLAAWLAADKPFLGICVGYQMLFEESEESPGVRGFGFFPGKVKRFTTPGLKIPQIGWNQLDLTDAAYPLWRGLPAHPHVYFVHSYFPDTTDRAIITSRSTYGENFAASAARGRAAGVQFHPEKSQAVGLAILRNFISSVRLGRSQDEREIRRRSRLVKATPRNLTARQRLLLWLCGGAFLAVGIALFVGLVLDALYGYWRTRSSVTTEARLQSVESRRIRVRGGYKTYPIVRYQYQVGSESFSGERIALFNEGSDFSGQLSSAFHSGTPIRVFIDPHHPRFAVINREFSWWPFAGGILSYYRDWKRLSFCGRS